MHFRSVLFISTATLQVQAASTSCPDGFNCLPLLPIFIFATTQSISSRTTQIMSFPHSKCFSGSYSSLTAIQTSCEALHSHSAVSPFQIMPSSPDTRASSLSLQEGEPSANSEHCVCHSSWSHSRCSAHRGAWKLLNIC